MNRDAVGYETLEELIEWTDRDALLYALGVGCGVDDLQFTTENSAGVQPKVLPTFGIIVGNRATLALKGLGDFDWTKIVHGEQQTTTFAPLPIAGSARVISRITSIFDKGTAAVVGTVTEGRDPSSGDLLFSNYMSVVIRGEGGWGGERGVAAAVVEMPSRNPDFVVQLPTSCDQGLIYRLSGDRHPLHSDPKYASAAGFERPILHGLCTFGFAARALLTCMCDNDPSRFRSVAGRFSAPTFPGETLSVEIWKTAPDEAVFLTKANDRVVIDRGVHKYA